MCTSAEREAQKVNCKVKQGFDGFPCSCTSTEREGQKGNRKVQQVLDGFPFLRTGTEREGQKANRTVKQFVDGFAFLAQVPSGRLRRQIVRLDSSASCCVVSRRVVSRRVV